jgi:hypothetical protein
MTKWREVALIRGLPNRMDREESADPSTTLRCGRVDKSAAVLVDNICVRGTCLNLGSLYKAPLSPLSSRLSRPAVEPERSVA